MPPASRGYTFLSRRVLQIQRKRCYASLEAPPPSKKFGAKIPRRDRAPRAEQRTSKEEPLLYDGPPPFSHRFMPRWLRKRTFLRSSIFSFVVTAPITLFALYHFPLAAQRVTGPSMQPTINSGCESDHDASYSPTWVLVQKFGPNSIRDLNKRSREHKQAAGQETVTTKHNRGDLVVYQTPHDPEKIAVKRIVAVAGDTVVPMQGYPGGQEPVVIPFNHLWVEGDVNDRKKSVDSNYFGPISRALVKGQVTFLWSPWWNIFGLHRPDQDFQWPAKRQRRVAEDAVHEASANPDLREQWKIFEGERAEKTLQFLREQSERIEARFATDDAYKAQICRQWVNARMVAKSHHDPEVQQHGKEIKEELERLIGRDKLRAAQPDESERKKKPARRAMKAPSAKPNEVLDDNSPKAAPMGSKPADSNDAPLSPAKAALEEMLQKKKQLGEMIDKEMEERDKLREAREL